ncbi:MAG: N-acetyl-gamma-glutamyl-phosphate reductase, partial [Lachnoanaerobaculum sp.]|nr:N-acetyl-gamma-glutamyl-phosphate reductase [Lachnoanaerobaculum sp.]
MIKVGIVGATGYAGAELVRLLLQRDDVKIVGFGSKSFAGESYSKVFRIMYKYADDICENDNVSELSKKADIIFTATPQGFLAENINDEVLANAKVIDLSADFRIKDVDVYEKWYKLEHKSKNLIKEAVYGLPELYREDIKKARLIANPGCYPTCSILSLQPLLKHKLIDKNSIIIDAKSG